MHESPIDSRSICVDIPIEIVCKVKRNLNQALGPLDVTERTRMNRVTYWLNPGVRQDSSFCVNGNHRLTSEQWCECEVARLRGIGSKAHVEKDSRGRVAVVRDDMAPVPEEKGERDVPEEM